MEYAIVIGIDHYPDRPLAGAVDDARRFADWLTQNNHISNPQKNLYLLVSDIQNQVALGHEIDLAINEISKDARPRKTEINRLYFYFSGHGIGMNFSDTALCMRLWPQLPNWCISGLAYKNGIINKGVFDEILFFFDCCRDVNILVNGRDPGFDGKTKVGDRIPKILLCHSTSYGKVSYEIPTDNNSKRGAFTSFLLESLSGEADQDHDGVITAYELKTHTEKHFESFAARHQKFQKAQIDTEAGGDAIVICKLSSNTVAHNCEINFLSDGDITLYDPNINEIRRAPVKTGDVWKLQLAQGFYKIVNHTNDSSKYFANLNENTILHESF
jgi:Caspase domain